MAYNKAYTRIVWVNESDGKITPLGAINLNKMDYGISVLDERIVSLSSSKADQSTVLNLVSSFYLDEETGVITITKLNGEQIVFDLNIEKIPVNFELSEDGILTMTTDDGSVFTADIGNMIPVLEFESSDEILVNISGEGANKTYSFSIKKGSITEDKLQPNFLADVTVQAQNASKSEINALTSENNSKKYAENASGYADTAKNEADRAEAAADRAESVSGVGIASETIAGLMAGGDNAVSEDGTLMLTKVTTDRTLKKSKPGGLKINSIEGESQQPQFSGKNKLQNTATSQTISGVVFTINPDESITVKGTATGNIFNKVATIKAIANTEYIYSDGNPNVDRTKITSYMMKGSSWITGNFTTETDENIDCYIYIATGTTVNATFYPMIRLASITDSTYEPYVGNQPSPNPDYPQSIDSVVVSEIKAVWKNLLKIKTLPENSVTRGITFTPNGYGGIKLNGTAEQNSDLSIVGYYGYSDTDLQTFGQKVIVSKTGIDGVEIHVGKGIINYTSSTATKDLVIDTTEKPISWIVLRVVKGTTLNNVTVYPMIRPADIEDDTYEPYTEKKITLSAPITLRGIGDVKDTICKKNGVYGVLRKIGSGVLDSTKSWSFSNNNGNLFRLVWFISGADKAYTISSSHFMPVETYGLGWENLPDNHIMNVDGAVGLKMSSITTLEDFKTWLSENSVSFIYERKTPTFEPLPIADQIALHQLETFDTVTYISTDSTIEPIIEVEYGTSKVGAYAIKGMNDVEVDKLTLPVANLATTVAGKPLDATMGKALFDYIQENALPIGVLTSSSSGALSWDCTEFSEALLKIHYAGSEASKYVSSYILRSEGGMLDSVSFYTYGNDSLVTILLEIGKYGVSVIKAKEWFIDADAGTMRMADILAGDIRFTAYLKPPVTTYII